MLRKSLLPALAVCVIALAPAALAQKVGVINTQRAILETADIKKASADLQTKYKPRQDQLDKLQREIADLQTQLESSAGKLSAAGQADLEAQGQRKQREAQRISEDLQADVDRERNEVLQRAQTRMTEVLKKLSDEKGLDIVVDTGAVPFFKVAFEITEDAIKSYDKAYPPK
ncbi:MAG TPA: OmpH family outer membrane protein [Bryobacteraceae bacterium]|nr:OmpH family outer membrane protein [Bryobacteraceae bacterium]